MRFRESDPATKEVSYLVLSALSEESRSALDFGYRPVILFQDATNAVSSAFVIRKNCGNVRNR